MGTGILDTFEPDLAEKMIELIEKNCLSEVSFTKPDGKQVKIKGVDFIDNKTAANLGRKPLVSPEWTFQLINTYRRLELDYKEQGDLVRETKYRDKKQKLIKSMLDLAIESNGALAYPYATQAEAVIGHEYNTPKQGNLSTIGVSYAILALTGYEPLVYSGKQSDTIYLKKDNNKSISLKEENVINKTKEKKILEKSNFVSIEPFAKSLMIQDNETDIILTKQAITVINFLSSAYNSLILEVDADALIDTSKNIVQLKGIGFKETVLALYNAKQHKDIPQNLRIRIINVNSSLDKVKITRALGLTEDLLKEFVTIPEIPPYYFIKGLESYLVENSIRIVFEDNAQFYKKVDVLVKKGKENEVISGLGLIVAALAKEPKFYQELPSELKDHIKTINDDKGNIALDEQEKIKQLIFKPIEKIKVDIHYLDRLNKINKELEIMV